MVFPLAISFRVSLPILGTASPQGSSSRLVTCEFICITCFYNTSIMLDILLPVLSSFTVPSIISGKPTVELDGENATFTVTFATIPSVTFNVVSTAIVEINITARREDADLIRETTAFPPDCPRVTTTQIHITNLTQGTGYRYTVRVLTTSNYFTAVVIPSVVTGTFPMTTQGM